MRGPRGLRAGPALHFLFPPKRRGNGGKGPSFPFQGEGQRVLVLSDLHPLLGMCLPQQRKALDNTDGLWHLPPALSLLPLSAVVWRLLLALGRVSSAKSVLGGRFLCT